jgi:hypothetical protein
MDSRTDPLSLDIEDLLQARDPLIGGQFSKHVISVGRGREHFDDEERLLGNSAIPARWRLAGHNNVRLEMITARKPVWRDSGLASDRATGQMRANREPNLDR